MYQAGYAEGSAVDHDRRSWRTNEPRPLAWAAWYPVASDAIVTERLLGDPGKEIFSMGRVALNAPLSSAREKWPVVLLSHGTGGTAQGLGWLGRRLASKGFICIGVSHHGNTAIEPYVPEGFLCWWERARDLTIIVDLLDKESILAGRLDMKNVFASGFSLGGYTALSLAGAITSLPLFQAWLRSDEIEYSGPLEFPDLADHVPKLKASSEKFRASLDVQSDSYRDDRVKAIMVFAPPPPVRAFKPRSIAEISIPVTMMVGQSDHEAPHEQCAFWVREQNAGFGVELLGTNVGHYVFLNEATELGRELEPTLCRDEAGVDRQAIHEHGASATETLFRALVIPPQ